MAIPKTYEDVAAEVEEFNRMLAEVPFHLQAEVFFVEQMTNKSPFYPLFKARIVRIFRSEGLRIGDEVSFRIWAGNENIYGGESPADYKKLRETKYFELLLEVSSYRDDELKVSGWRKIDELTDNPVIVKESPPQKVEYPVPPLTMPTKQCPRCRAKIPPNGKFCGCCGLKY